MPRWVPVLATLAFVFAVGCAEDDFCTGGVCETEAECVEICEEFCEGAVLDAFCSFDEVCTCECEFSCLL